MKVVRGREEKCGLEIGAAGLTVSYPILQHCSPTHWGNDTSPCAVYDDMLGAVRSKLHGTGSVTPDCLRPSSPRGGHKYA